MPRPVSWLTGSPPGRPARKGLRTRPSRTAARPVARMGTDDPDHSGEGRSGFGTARSATGLPEHHGPPTVGLTPRQRQACRPAQVPKITARAPVTSARVHLVPADRAGRRTIDGHRACEAIAAPRPSPDFSPTRSSGGRSDGCREMSAPTPVHHDNPRSMARRPYWLLPNADVPRPVEVSASAKFSCHVTLKSLRCTMLPDGSPPGPPPRHPPEETP